MNVTAQELASAQQHQLEKRLEEALRRIEALEKTAHKQGVLAAPSKDEVKRVADIIADGWERGCHWQEIAEAVVRTTPSGPRKLC